MNKFRKSDLNMLKSELNNDVDEIYSRDTHNDDRNRFPGKHKPARKKKMNSIAAKGGLYALAVSVIIFAILLVVNIFVGLIPSSATSLDISSSQLYSITSSTKVILNSLEDDITIYWIVQSGEEDSVIQKLLSKYESASNHVEVEKVNPDVSPTFAEQYTDEEVANNSFVVECGDKYRYIAYDEIYLTDVDYDTYSYVYSFDGEGAITSAIDYVTSEDLPQLYMLTGHGEDDLSEIFSDQITRENMEVTEFSILEEEEIPEEADCVLIYAPTTDISEEEAEILIDYAEDGGKLMVVAGPSADDDLDVLSSILENYGVSVAEGIVVESDPSYYFQYPYLILPTIESSDITDTLIDEGYYMVMPISSGLIVDDDTDVTVSELLTTTDTSFSKAAGYELDTYEEEDGDIDGPFALAVSITCTNDGEIIWFASSDFLIDDYNSLSSGANLDAAMNALSQLVGDTQTVTITSKSLSYNYLTISSATSTAIQVIMIGVLPIACITAGIIVFVRRRLKRDDL